MKSYVFHRYADVRYRTYESLSHQFNISLKTKSSNQFGTEIVPYRQLSTSEVQATWYNCG
jgi:hypothetical protein